MDIREELRQRFLKRPPEIPRLEIGDDLPDIPLPDGSTLHAWMEDYMLVCVLSTQCKPCMEALEALDAVSHQGEKQLVALVDTDNESYEELWTYFQGRLKIYKVKVFESELGSNGVPWGYAVNRNMQIVVSSVINTREHVEQLALPFQRAKEAGKRGLQQTV